MSSRIDKKPLKILRITASMNPQHGGPVQMIRSTSAIHESMGHQTDVLSLDTAGSDYLENQAFTSIALGPGKYGWAYSSRIKPWLEKHLQAYDAVIIHGLWLYPSIAAAKVFAEKRKHQTNLPICFVFPHGMLDPWFQSWKRRPIKTLRNALYWHLFEKRTIRTADAVLFTSQTEARLSKQTFKGYRSKQDIIVPYGCVKPPASTAAMSKAFEEKCPAIKGKPYWLYLSRIHPKKGLDLLLSEYLKLRSKASSGGSIVPHLVIAGPGMDTDFGRNILDMASHASEFIHFPGMLETDAKWGAFYGSCGFFLPSHQENFGISVAEALGCGTRVYISNQVNIHEEIQKCDAGIVANNDEAGVNLLLKQALINFNAGLSEEYRKKAIDCFERYFNIEKTAVTLVDLIHATP